MRKAAPISIIVCYPKTEKGRREIARKIAAFQASKATAYLEKINCPSWQKIELIDATIKGLKQSSEFEGTMYVETGIHQCDRPLSERCGRNTSIAKAHSY